MYWVNAITFCRILFSPLVLLFYLYAGELWSFLLFSCLALGDIVDGALARRFNQVSKLGAFLDPLADKVLTSFAFLCLFYQKESWFFMLTFIAFLFRDALVTMLRLLFTDCSANVSGLAKAKSFILNIALGGMLFSSVDLFDGYRLFFAGVLLLSLFLAYYTGIRYFFSSFRASYYTG